MIYGIYLPKEVLEKIYHKNAERVLYRRMKEKSEHIGQFVP